MAADGYGSKGEPEFDDGGAPDTAVDPTLVAEYAGIVGNRVVDTSTARAAFSSIWPGFSGGPWNGLEFYESDTGVLYVRANSAWVATGTVALLDKNGTGYSVPNNAFTQLTDTYLATTKLRGMTTSGGAVTVPTDGLYRVTASALFAANGTGSRQVDVTKNSTVAGVNDVLAGNVAGSAIVNGTVYASKVIPLAAGDVLRLFLYQNSGASLALGTGGQTVGTFFHVEFAGMP